MERTLLTNEQMKDLLKKIQREQMKILHCHNDLTFNLGVNHGIYHDGRRRVEAYYNVSISEHGASWYHFDFYQFNSIEENMDMLKELRKKVKEIINK